MLSRAERVGNGLVDHLYTKEDMLLFDLSTSKTDPTGILSYAKCIASNPFEPFSDLWEQCKLISNERGINLGSTHQGATTFYNTVCSNKAVKGALLSPARDVSIVAACQ